MHQTRPLAKLPTVRRLEQNETFHGTAGGQIPNVADLAKRLGLTERQAQCAALLRMGNPPQDVALTLGISRSTLEAHLADLRRSLNAEDAEALERRLHALIGSDDLDAFHCWPVQTNAPHHGASVDSAFGARLSNAFSLEQGLHALQSKLANHGVSYCYYCFLPHSVKGFLRGDVIDLFLGPRTMVELFHESGGILGQPAALTLFDAPTSTPMVNLNAQVESVALARFYEACRSSGGTHLMALGFPAGPAFVGMALVLRAKGDNEPLLSVDDAEDIRADAMAMHAAMLTNGAIAARVRLTMRERNALSAIALGKRAADAATELNVSERGVAKLLASAREKLNARTNAEAVGKAALINALVFL